MYAGRPQPWLRCVRWGPSSPQRGRAQSPQFSAHICCCQMAAWIKMPLGMEVGLGSDYIVLDGDRAALPENGGEPPSLFSAHFYSDQTAGCIKMPLGMEVGLSPRDFVSDGDPVPSSKRGRRPSIFGPCLSPPNRRRDQDATGYGGRPRPRRHCVRWGPRFLLPERGQSPPLPNFRPMSIVAKRLDGSRWHLAWRLALVQATLC